jgi:membrane protease YdiL (CAAX protease family)
MLKGFILYVFSLILLFLSAWQENLAWLTPLTLGVLLVGSILLWRADGKPLRELGFRRTAHWGRFLGSGLVIGGLIPLIVLLIMWVGEWADVSFEAGGFQVILSGVILAVIRIALIAGSEELVFRGFFFQSMKMRIGFLSAAIGSAILWALTHLPDMYFSGLSVSSILIGIATFILWGVVLAMCVRLGEDSLWLPFGLHFGYNLVFSIVGYFLVSTIEGSEWILGHPAWRPESGILGLALWIFGVVILGYLLNKEKRNLLTNST